MLKDLFSPAGHASRVSLVLTLAISAAVEFFVTLALASSRQNFSPEVYYLITAAATFPFAWVQICVTIRRLLSLGWHAALALPVAPAALWPLWGVLGLEVSSIAGLALILSASYSAGLLVLLLTYAGAPVSPRAPSVEMDPPPAERTGAATVTCPNGHLYEGGDGGACPYCAVQPVRPIPLPVNPDLLVGWLVVIEGPGIGDDFRLRARANRLGSDSSMDVRLADAGVTPQEHASVVFEAAGSAFLLRPGAGSVTLNGNAVIDDEPLALHDRITVGSSTLLFVPFAGQYHRWEETAEPAEATPTLRRASLISIDGRKGFSRRLDGTTKWDELVELALADSVLAPKEAQLVLARAGALGLTETEARARLMRRLQESGFQPMAAGGEPLTTLPADPFSVAWSGPSGHHQPAPGNTASPSGPQAQTRVGKIVSGITAFLVAIMAILLVPRMMSGGRVDVGGTAAVSPVQPDSPTVEVPGERNPAPDEPRTSSDKPVPDVVADLRRAPPDKPLPPPAPPPPVVADKKVVAKKKIDPPSPLKIDLDLGSQVVTPPPVLQTVDISKTFVAAVQPVVLIPEPLPPEVPPTPVPTTSPPPTAYSGPMAGALTCSGIPVVQNGEVVFRNLPPRRLQLTLDEEVWEARLSPGEGNTQRLILRNRKPGTQRKCAVTWRVIQ